MVFKCGASGVPHPKVTWTFNGGALPPYTTEEGHLSINSVVNNASYEGNYTCSAESIAGKVSYTVTLTVHGKGYTALLLEGFYDSTRYSELVDFNEFKTVIGRCRVCVFSVIICRTIK